MKPSNHPSRARTIGDSSGMLPYSHFGLDVRYPRYHGDACPSSSPFATSPSISSHPFSPVEVDECDKYNPLILHHALIQSIPRTRENQVPLHKGSPISRWHDDQSHYGGACSQVARPRRHNLLGDQGPSEIIGKLGLLKIKANSEASTTMSIALGQTIISPTASSSVVAQTSLSTSASTTCTKSANNVKNRNPETNPNRAISIPDPSPSEGNLSRRMSHTVKSPPKFLETIVQRVWNPQQKTPVTNPSPPDVTGDDTKNFSMSDSNLMNHSNQQSWASSSFIENASSYLSRPPHYDPSHDKEPLFEGRFIRQVTFSLEETHRSALQAILVLRQLSNGLTSVPITPLPRARGSRYPSPRIPIPKISHRYPEKSSTIIVEGRTKLVHNKTIPRVVINWSDGAREQFDPSKMTLEEILERCHYISPPGNDAE